MDQINSNVVDYKRIGLRIRKQRKEKGLSHEQLAELVGISLSFMGHIERGTRIASVETLARLSEALELDMHYIVFGCSSGYRARSGKSFKSFEQISFLQRTGIILALDFTIFVSLRQFIAQYG